MNKSLSKILISCLLLLSCRDSFRIMTYNVQNLFDDILDGSEYPEYKPASSSWSRELYHKKLSALARVIRETAGGRVDLIALQEVENRNVVEQLAREYLSGCGYEYIVLVPVENSAINIAFLSRNPILYTRALNLRPERGHPLRNILEIKLEHRGQFLYVFNNHWKSKSGSVAETEISRLESAALLKERLQEILSGEPGADIVITGDFNENLYEYSENGKSYQTAFIPAEEVVPAEYSSASLFLTADSQACGIVGESLLLYDTWFTQLPEARGSYYYRDSWQNPDHILLTGGLFDQQGFTFASFRVIREPFLLQTQTGKPLAWRNDGSGYSDHLPLLLELMLPDPAPGIE